MIATLQRIMSEALERLIGPLTAFMPRLIAAVLILAVGILLAVLARWAATRLIKASGIDRFLAQSGFASLLGFTGRVRTSRLVSETAWWLVIIATVMTALTALDTALTTRLTDAVLLLLPRLATAAAIVLAGLWVGQYLARSTLVWASNEGLRRPRLIAAVVRGGVVLAAAAAAAEHLDFARSVFLAGFVIAFGGAVLTLALALSGAARSFLLKGNGDARETDEPELQRSHWDHL